MLEIAGYEFEASPNTWAQRENGGGYLYGQLVHQLGLALALIDSPPREVFARLELLLNGVDILRRRPRLEFRGRDDRFSSPDTGESRGTSEVRSGCASRASAES